LQRPYAPASSRAEAVAAALQTLGLDECANRRLGSGGGGGSSSSGGGSGEAGLSGGERRRVAVAVELLGGSGAPQRQGHLSQQLREASQPLRLVVADEATSGLDARAALQVVRQDRNATGNKNLERPR
jgi:ABC-type transport system involved in cytochrome bd biosynthesis fused ATPase/permease subunit